MSSVWDLLSSKGSQRWGKGLRLKFGAQWHLEQPFSTGAPQLNHRTHTKNDFCSYFFHPNDDISLIHSRCIRERAVTSMDAFGHQGFMLGNSGWEWLTENKGKEEMIHHRRLRWTGWEVRVTSGALVHRNSLRKLYREWGKNQLYEKLLRDQIKWGWIIDYCSLLPQDRLRSPWREQFQREGDKRLNVSGFRRKCDVKEV